MLILNRTLEEFLDDATLLMHAPEFLDYEESDVEQDLRNEVVLCESTAAIMGRMRLERSLEAWPERGIAAVQLPVGDYHPSQRHAIRQDEVQPWEA